MHVRRQTPTAKTKQSDEGKKKHWEATINRILDAYNEISKSINPAQLVKMDLTSSQMKVLMSFAAKDNFTMTELSTVHSVSVSTMTSMVDRLIQNGLLQRDKDDKDRRIVRVGLSKTGNKVVSHLMSVRKRSLEQFLRELNNSEIKEFLHSIEAVAHFLAKAKKNILSQ